jgi:hypothetical protein
MSIQFKQCLMGLWNGGLQERFLSLYANRSLVYLGDHFGDTRGEEFVE